MAALAWFAALSAHAEVADRVARIKGRGELVCGILPGVAGFARVDPQGSYSGFDIDTCRAIAVAILARPDQVRFVAAASVSQLESDADLDLVVRRLTWTMSREAETGLLYGPVTFYDGQGFLVTKSSGLTSSSDFSGKRICVDPGEDWSRNLAGYLKSRAIPATLVMTGGRADGEKRFFSRQCDVYSADRSMLGAIRADAPRQADYLILPEMISEEPLAPLMRQGDDRFFLVVRWTIFAMIDAEVLGITSKNADSEIGQLMGGARASGKALGLDENWAYRVVSAVGNYGEMYDRNLGPDGAIRLDRDRNRLWTQGGLIYAPPLR